MIHNGSSRVQKQHSQSGNGRRPVRWARKFRNALQRNDTQSDWLGPDFVTVRLLNWIGEFGQDSNGGYGWQIVTLEGKLNADENENFFDLKKLKINRPVI